MRRVRLLAAAMAESFALAACGGDGGSGGGASATASCSPGGKTLSISSKDIKFDKACLAAPANQAFTIKFDNKEPLPHNVAVFRLDGAADTVFLGELIVGPAKVDYEVGGLPPGTYLFHCSVHPEQMKGTLVVK